ncbi:MAG: nickel-dependent lactate racemase [Deltaproteobacteria bacterium]|nr:nickel-dependent lactate racemase [Deltaproteobacteria bacterium]
MEIELAYGRETRKVRVEDKALIVRMPPVPPLNEPALSLLEGLNQPIGSPPLKDCLKKGRVVVVTSDKTRLVRYPIFLPSLLDYLNKEGVRDSDISLVIGRGNHGGHSPDEIRVLFGEDVFGRVEIMEHDCHDRAHLVEVGKTRYGNPVLLNQRAVEAENVILTGAIKFHPYSGFSGGRKAVLPGISGFETLQRNHKIALSSSRCGLGVLDGNPVHEEMLDAARLLDPCFLINVVCNESGQIARLFVGHWQKAHEEGCGFVREVFCPEVEGQADLVIASASGYPDDINLYQSLKAVDNISPVVRDGGVMMLLAECRDGFGPEELLEWFDGEDLVETRARLEKEFSIPGYVALCLKKTAERIRIVLVSSLAHASVRRAAMIPASTPDEGLQEARKYLPSRFSTWIFPQGGSHVPVLKGKSHQEP